MRIPVHHDSVDHTWMVETVRGLQHELLDRYDAVLVTDVDEIVSPAPDWGTLGDYIDEFGEWFVNCIGYEILHMVDREGPYDPSRPILDQRGYWFANGAYNKPALATGPMDWLPGFHHRADGQVNPDPNLYLIHLHRMDFDICRERHRGRRGRAWNEADLGEGWACVQPDRRGRRRSSAGSTRTAALSRTASTSRSSGSPSPGGACFERARTARQRTAQAAGGARPQRPPGAPPAGRPGPAAPDVRGEEAVAANRHERLSRRLPGLARDRRPERRRGQRRRPRLSPLARVHERCPIPTSTSASPSRSPAATTS